jgi:hypothetical protein
VLQHIPLDVIVEPPFVLIFPPEVAVVRVIPDTVVVVKTGKTAEVVNVISLPYPVPPSLVAYALT